MPSFPNHLTLLKLGLTVVPTEPSAAFLDPVLSDGDRLLPVVSVELSPGLLQNLAPAWAHLLYKNPVLT